MNTVKKDRALFLAECLMDYCHEKERQERLRRKQYIEHKKEMRYSRKSVSALIFVAIVMVVLCVNIVSLGMQVREREKKVSVLAEELSEIRKENQDAQKRLSNNADYRWVREEALKLGMSQVSVKQVIYYSVEDVDYMVQYDDIPKG